MNLRLLFILFISFCGCIMMAQSPEHPTQHPQRTPEQEAQKRTERMKRELLLTDTQEAEVYKINLKYAELRRQPATHEDIIARIQAMNAELQAILTPEQFEKYKTYQSGRHHKPHPCLTERPAQAS